MSECRVLHDITAEWITEPSMIIRVFCHAIPAPTIPAHCANHLILVDVNELSSRLVLSDLHVALGTVLELLHDLDLIVHELFTSHVGVILLMAFEADKLFTHWAFEVDCFGVGRFGHTWAFLFWTVTGQFIHDEGFGGWKALNLVLLLFKVIEFVENELILLKHEVQMLLGRS